MKLKHLLAAIVGMQASFSLATAQDMKSENLRLVESLSAQERTELRAYLNSLKAQGYEIDLKKYVIAIDQNNQVIFLERSKVNPSIYSAAGEPSCMSGGSGVAKQ